MSRRHTIDRSVLAVVEASGPAALVLGATPISAFTWMATLEWMFDSRQIHVRR